ncbi:MAG: TonB-dependent receptor [Bacteroidetes bacterium]|nr:TonB-dependent receptor [Bacteroidota bacterium]
MRQHRTILALLFFCAFVPGVLTGQAARKGSIVGKVVDAKTREGLPGANVLIKGTYYGGASDVDGSVRIMNVGEGTYTLEVSLLGYKPMQFTNIVVLPGDTTTFTAPLEETVLTLDQEIVIVGEKPLFDIEETASRRTIGQSEIRAAAVQSVESIVSLQPGVVYADNEIHIRGGRTHENAYLLDGVSVQDPLAGTGFGLQLSPSSIKEVEVITGGYNAEYGQATSGIVNITTREGADVYSGALGYKTDHYGLNNESRADWNTDIFDLYLSGPEPVTTYLLPVVGLDIPGELSFFGTLYANYTDGYTRWVETIGNDNRPTGYEIRAPSNLFSSLLGTSRYSPRRSNSYSGLVKLTYRPAPTYKLSYAYNQSVLMNQNTQTVQVTLERVEPNPGYQYLFQNIPDSANTFTQKNSQHVISWTHTRSEQTFYELRYSKYTAHVRGDANGKSFDAYIEPQDIVTYPIRYFNVETDTIGVVPGDGFYDLGSPTSWRDHYIDEYTFKLDLTNYFSERNRFKAGIEMRFQNMQMADIVRPWIGTLGFDNDLYTVSPALGAFYVQDNVTLSGMILNVGLRLDYWVPGKYVDDVAKDTSTALIVPIPLRQQYLEDTFTLFGYQMKARLSPRIGISHPISDNQTLFFSYGHFSKIPRPQFVYSKLWRTSVRSSLPVGNPNLNPETTVAYELGIRNQLSGDDVLTITAFYKDIFDYITEKRVRRLSDAGGAQFFTTYLNSDYSRIRGIELEYKKRIGAWFRGSLSGSFSVATGKSSTPNEDQLRLQQGEPENIKERFLIWDRPVQVAVNLNFIVPKGAPLFGIGNGILDDWNLFFRFFYQSGKRYTPYLLVGADAATGRPEYIRDISRELEFIGDDWFIVNFNVEKYFDFGFGTLVASVEVQNVLDRKNTQIVNPVTGRAYEFGDPTPTSRNDPLFPQLTGDIDPFPYNPARYLSPRTLLLSLAFRF